MSWTLIIFLVILFVIAMFFTFYAFKQEEMKMKKYEEDGDTVADELKRSHEYENTSVQNYLPIQGWIYIIAIIVTIIAFVVYLY